MHQKNDDLKRIQTPTPQKNEKSPESMRTSDIDVLLNRVDQLLQANSPDKALTLIANSKIKTPWLRNATAVCQLRLGNPQVAIEIYRSLLVNGGIFLRADAPVVFKVNFAVALLLNQNLPGFYNALSELKDEEHPSIPKLKAAVKNWRQQLTLWQKFQLICGNQPHAPLELGFAPGDLK
ncbi:hypothetical protein [Gimesia algae]|uniref:Tetratricopeptide repeat protein n=1 Tax=Gimesia algae TaxID=2527971 RepID=A0A517VDN7_9PLAN|nr:hypothetical protein [Gimesia algae]QDT91120.1 hypothetical protein Pan161_27750 [Gimesia algae]